MVHMRGERLRAHRIFAAMLEQIPADWKITTHDVVAREYYAERLAAEGRAAEAIPFLETAERSYIERPAREFDLRRVRLTLGDAYDRAGRPDDARRMLRASLDERLKKDAAESSGLLGARERWARFLLDRGETAAAEAELGDVLRVAGDRAIPAAALAHDDLARSALNRGDAAAALAQSTAAVAILDRITGLHDVRIAPRIWRTHAAALQLGGETRKAAEWNEKALVASRKYDDPSSPTVQVAAAAR
jgi:tetratricopeptide (TPR) repeat protein